MSNQPDLHFLLDTSEPASLGPAARPGTQTEEALEEQLEQAFRASQVPSDGQQVIRALILLWHDHLDAAHRLAQEVDNADGAFVHGMMHRREPDFGNAAYWFRRVGRHPAYESIAREVERLSAPNSIGSKLATLVQNGQWNPFAFIDACEQAQTNPAQAAFLKQVQQIEFAALLSELQGR